MGKKITAAYVASVLIAALVSNTAFVEQYAYAEDTDATTTSESTEGTGAIEESSEPEVESEDGVEEDAIAISATSSPAATTSDSDTESEPELDSEEGQATTSTTTDADASSDDSEVPEASTTSTTTNIVNDIRTASSGPATTTSSTTVSNDGEEEESADLEDTSSTGTVTVESGKAVALANILNVINTNLVNSEGAIYFSNFIDAVNETIDLRALYDAFIQVACSLAACASDNTLVTIQNDGTIDNAVYVEATSGGNEITNTGGAEITTGDAFAGLNLINLANMNFVDSQYLLVTINAFDDMNGDIVFPSATEYLRNLGTGSSGGDIALSNDAEVANDITASASAGGNELTDVASGTIETGDAGASANVFNEINNSVIGGSNITILFRVHGNWAGELFGAPEGLVWAEGPDGNVFLFDVTDSGTTTARSGSVSVDADNTASINNSVTVAALTGENAITNADTALISTGDAYAGVNVINAANGNIIGRNWILAIVNIFGDFNGNIAFGRPDLWIGEQIIAPGRVRSGTEVTYAYTVINNGDSVATDVRAYDTFDTEHIKVLDASIPYAMDDDGRLEWQLGSIRPGEAVEFSYDAQVRNVKDSVNIENIVEVDSHETDNNDADNSDTAAIFVRTSRTVQSQRITRTKEVALDTALETNNGEGLTVRRDRQVMLATTDSPMLSQILTLYNASDAIIRSVTYHDVLKNAAGDVIHDEVWELGDIQPKEEIQIGYDITFGPGATSGKFMLASVLSQNGTVLQDYENGSVWFMSLNPLRDITAQLAANSLQQSNVTVVRRDLSVDGTTQTDEPYGPRVLGASTTRSFAGAVDLSVLEYIQPERVSGLAQLKAYVQSFFSSIRSFLAVAHASW